MTNPHFGRISEVWKHMVLAEVLAIEQPATFLDTHSGDARYPVVEDPERRYGVLTFNEIAAEHTELRDSAYAGILATLRRGSTLDGIPGGPLVAMAVLADRADYLFCDRDGESASNIRSVAAARGASTVRVLTADGMASVHDALAHVDPGRTLVFIDPFDHQAVGTTGLSALDVAGEAVRAGALLVYWYGYNRIDQRQWIFDLLVERGTARTWWCGDLMVAAENADMTTGDLGVASTPGTGSGMVCANASAATVERCAALGTALAAAYRDRPLPSGELGALDFRVRERQ